MVKRIISLLLIDILMVVITLFIAFALRFDFVIPPWYNKTILIWLPIFISSQVLVFLFTDLYSRIWRFTSIIDLFAIFKSVSLSFLIGLMILSFFFESYTYPRSVLFLFYLLNIISICIVRVSVRVYHNHFSLVFLTEQKIIKKKMILIGAGHAGEKIAREIDNTALSKYKIIGFFDDDLKKIGQRLHGYKIFGPVNTLETFSEDFDETLICAPRANGDQIRRIVDSCKKTEKPYKILPSLDELIHKELTINLSRKVSLVDLLGRDEVKLNKQKIKKFIKGKRILISGAGGSIGSELLKQSLSFNPSEIICIDNNEEKIFNLQIHGTDIYKFKSKTLLKTVLTNIKDYNQLEKVFNENRPHIVFHAAAFKHVPIQELHPWTAVDTNVGGTKNIIELSDKYNVEKFVLVSTDKAVNPSNIMGATKRLAEKLIQSINIKSKTQFMAVRFGNVLGSSGSAIPIFQKQIKDGGPVTITHPEMTRYFMSIPEASQLILQCGSIGSSGEIFLLKMGKPIKIDSLARDLIKLSGLEPNIDIPIVYSGLRPGEKLYEELRYMGEKIIKTDYRKILILRDGKMLKPYKELISDIEDLFKISSSLDASNIQSKLMELIPTYSPVTDLKTISDRTKILPYSIKGEA